VVANLASAADLVARLGRDFTPDEQVRVDALLADASAMIRAYTGRDFTLTEDDTVVLRASGRRDRQGRSDWRQQHPGHHPGGLAVRRDRPDPARRGQLRHQPARNLVG
jgi:hypothetical protein